VKVYPPQAGLSASGRFIRFRRAWLKQNILIYLGEKKGETEPFLMRI
jgi:hypothetical protein